MDVQLAVRWRRLLDSCSPASQLNCSPRSGTMMRCLDALRLPGSGMSRAGAVGLGCRAPSSVWMDVWAWRTNSTVRLQQIHEPYDEVSQAHTNIQQPSEIRQYTRADRANTTSANTNKPHSWSPSSAKMSTEAQTKKFQKGERVIPSATDKALKYYPAEDEQVMKKVRQHLRRSDGLERMRPLDMERES
jgi:hypothetical protein